MISLVTINLGTLFGILYFFISLFDIRNLNLQMYNTNYFSSLNNYGSYLTYITKKLFTINSSFFLVTLLLLSIKTEISTFNSHPLLYLYSTLGMLFSFIILIIIGYSYIKYNFILNEMAINEMDGIEFEYICKYDNIFYSFRCCICLEEKEFITRALLIPCNHKVFCKDCSIKICNMKTCPLCRDEIKKITIFINKEN